MKNYDIKSAVEELENKEVRITKNRIAFLVPNMFERVEKGFLKYVPKKEQEVKEVTQDVVNTKVQPVVETPVQQSIVEQPVQTEKNYTLKTKTSDMNVFNAQTKMVGSRPLLISVAFKSKLVANRASKMVKDVVENVSNSIEDAINKYHELLDERTSYIEKIKEIERQITILVKENNLTQEQVTRSKVA